MDRRLFAASVALTLFLTLFNSPGRAQPPSADEAALLERLITQHEATVQKIESSPIFVAYTWRTTTTVGPTTGPDGADLSGPMIAEGRARYWRDGTSFCEDRDLKNTWTESGEVRDGSNIFMINDRCAVVYRKKNAVLNLYHFDDRNKLPPAVESQLDLYPNPDPIDFCIRYSSRQSLKETYEQQVGSEPSRYRWTATEIDVEGDLYHKISIERIDGDNKRLHQEMLLDPRNGFLISESRTYNKAGEPFYVVQARFQQVAEGFWFPKSVTRNIEQGNKVSSMEVEKITVGDPKIGNMLTLDALEIDRDSIIMLEHSNQGTQQTRKGYLNGQWVPFDSLPPERKDAVNDAQRKANAGAQSAQRWPDHTSEQ